MKTIEDAVIELDGAYPTWTTPKVEGGLFISGDILWVDNYPDPPIYLCKKHEFEACTKRLGYINGYRWGVEYPTNGDKPNLGSDVWLSVKEINATDFDHPRQVLFVKWHAVQSFMITDQRLKPADTSYLDEVSGNPESNWYTRAELPPVGVECEVYNHTFGKNADWENCKILWRGEFLTVYASDSHHECSASNEHLEFRPIKAKSEREKVIEAAMKVSSGGLANEMYSALYNAGMLVLPPNKSDTKD